MKIVNVVNLTAISVLVIALLAGSVYAAPTIINGDFETGSDDDAPPTGWTDNTPTSFWLGVIDETGNPTEDEAADAPGGLGEFFLTTARQSTGASSQPTDGQLVQTIDLSELATEIDAGTQELNVDFIYASDDSRDTGTFSLHFFSSTDGSGTELTSDYSVALDAGSSYDFSGWQEMTVGGLVPVSARSVTLQIDTTRSGGSETNIWIDNISLRDSAMNPSPTDDMVAIDATLSWDAPEIVSDVTYNVYFGTKEPNSIDLEAAPYGLTQIGTEQTAVTATPVPSPMSTDMTYYWIVDTLEPNDVAPYEPIIYKGTVWSFSTIPSVPVIDPQPENILFGAGDADVTLTLSATSTHMPLTYKWYKDGDEITDLTAYSGIDSDTLVILLPDADDEGSYYCEVTGSNDGITNSDTVVVKMKALVAQYQFENDVTDSVGTNDLILQLGDLEYTAGVSDLAGQSYAADPNGTSYAELPEDAYPKLGFGNAYEEGSVGFWAKLDSSSYQVVMGSFNEGSTSAFEIECPTSNGDARFYWRDEDGSQIDCRTGDDVTGGDWHYIVVTYVADSDGDSKAAIYLDGELADSETEAALDNMAEWENSMTVLARNLRGTIDSEFKGDLDDLRIYNYRLTSEEVAQEYYDVTDEQSCIVANYSSDFDFNDDCIVNLEDFADLAAAWMESGWYPAD